jgi:hypothetical protein
MIRNPEDYLQSKSQSIMEYWSDGVLECCNNVAGFTTITPLLQYSNALKLNKNHNSRKDSLLFVHRTVYL